MKKHVFMISDGTGITAEHFGNSLLSQFEHISFIKETIPYVDSPSKMLSVIDTINAAFEKDNAAPLVFITLVDPDLANLISTSKGEVFHLFNTFLPRIESNLNTKAISKIGKTHSVSNNPSYTNRIEAVDYALTHDDGVKYKDYDEADIVLIGVSRSGKTPSCLYMALHFGILAANYPFTDDDFLSPHLPDALKPYRHKLFGLSIDPERLQQIREERRPNSPYSSLNTCKNEVAHIETLYQTEQIPYLNSTKFSIEEISTKILSLSGIHRKF